MTKLRIATRGSELARWQADEVGRLLAAAGFEVSLVVVSTTGDVQADRPVWEMGGQGVFVKEVQVAVLDGRADLAVHSAKDLPSSEADGLTLAAFPVRADPRDALVGSTLDGLAAGATVATGSVRRRAQLAWLRPDLTFTGLRGNIATRIDRVPPGGAVVVAAAALERLGLSSRAAELIDPSVMLPQVGQGAIVAECRSRDRRIIDALASIDDPAVRTEVTAERAFLSVVSDAGGGCDVPVAAYARVAGSDVHLEGMLASADGRVLIRSSRSATGDPERLGRALGEELLGAGGIPR